KKRTPVSSIADRIKEFNSNRLPAYTALKYQYMAENPFRFFRGTCHLFYEDLFHNDALPAYPLSWICGDLHLENFGSYKGENRLVYFDLNDFDESILAPATWEVVRMITSIFTGFDSLSIKRKDATQAAQLFLKVFSETLAKAKAKYLEHETANGIVRTFLEKVCERKQKDLVRQRTEEGKNGGLQFRLDRVRLFPLEKPLRKALMSHLNQLLHRYPLLKSRFQAIDVAFRVAGTGSLGVKRYVFLLRNSKDTKKHLLLDMKLAAPSSLQPYLTTPQPAWASEAERVVAVQHRMQNVNPALLSVTLFDGDPYVIKEMQPTADKIVFQVIRDRFKDVACVVEDMAFLTASAMLRSAGRQGAALPDELIAFGADTHWQQGLLDYSTTYAAQVKKDYTAYFKDYKAGFFNQPATKITQPVNKKG
ncbi:MAG TPA: DUF2252 family protein, partial [Puia sp.]|nr:DUF2252 family protein [Puia sp.]